MYHIEALSPLYEDVQLSRIFPDSKYFVDCSPKFPIKDILIAYELQKNNREFFNLKDFVLHHFYPPIEVHEGQAYTNELSINEHLVGLWDTLTRSADLVANDSTLIPLPHRYIVPGGRFREIYYWDSYFTILGLLESGRADMARSMVENFAYLIDKFGHVPNGNRTYYLSRSQPPFFALMVMECGLIKVGNEVFPTNQFLKAIEKEYAFWMDGSEQLSIHKTSHRRVVIMPDGSVLNRYWDDMDSPRPESYIEDVEIAHQSVRSEKEVYRHIRAAAESGWDFSSRWFADGQSIGSIETTDIIPIDLNCLLYRNECILSQMYKEKGEHDLSQKMLRLSEERLRAIQKYLWSDLLNIFGDYHHLKHQFINRPTLAMSFPLYFGIAPLQWMTYRGVLRYQETDIQLLKLGESIKISWMGINEKTYQNTGKMMEKYNVEDTNLEAGGGEYPGQDGFGWTNGVYLAICG
jgi:alpha,alpha-trehalase